MTWSAPMTAVAGATFTAAQFNQYVRDNLNECPTAKATGAAQFFVSTGVNAIAARQMSADTVLTSQTTTNSSYSDLATIGPQVTVNTGPRALVMFSCALDNTLTNGASAASVGVSGATTIVPTDNWRLLRDGTASGNTWRIGVTHLFDTLNTGSNTFTMKYRATGGTGTFLQREMIVLPF